MALGALGIIGGLGKGYRMGVEDVDRRKANEQQRKLREFEIDDANRKAKMREEEQAAYGDGIDADSAAIQAASQARVAGIGGAVAQKNADAAIARDTGSAIKAGVSDATQRLMAPAAATPTPAQMAAPPQAAGIKASAHNVSDLANTQTQQSPSANARPVTKDAADAQAWSTKAKKIAEIHRKYGDHAGADAILKSADSREMAVYDRQLQSATRDYAGGNYEAAAGKLSALWNMSNPDGPYVDVKSNGDSTFTLTPFGDDGKPGKPQVIGSEQVNGLLQTSLSPAERAKALIKAREEQGKNDRAQLGAQNRIVIEDKRQDGANTRNERTVGASIENNKRTTQTSAENNKRTTSTSSENNKRTTQTSAANNERTTSTSAGNVDKQQAGADRRTTQREAGKNERAPGHAAQFGKKTDAKPEAKPAAGKLVRDANGNYVYQR